MTQNPLPTDRIMAQQSPRGAMINQPTEPERVERPTEVDNTERYRDELSQIRGQTPASNQYRQMLSQTPRREDYSPNKLTRFAAVLGGASAGYRGGVGAGVNAARGINESGYRDALEDHDRNLQGAYHGAELERRDVGDRVSDLSTARGLNTADRSRTDTNFNADRGDSLDRFNAGTSRFGAGTGRMNAETGRMNAENTGEYYDNTSEYQRGNLRLGNRRQDFVEGESQRNELMGMGGNVGPPQDPGQTGEFSANERQIARDESTWMISQNPQYSHLFDIADGIAVLREDIEQDDYNDVSELMELMADDYIERTYRGF